MSHAYGKHRSVLRSFAIFVATTILLVVAMPIAAQTTNQGFTISVVSGNNQKVIPGQSTQALVVKVVDSSGAPASGIAVNWQISGATGSLGSASTKTDANGQSQNTASAILPATYQVTATADRTTGSATFTFINAVANVPVLTPAQVAVAHAIDNACPALATSSAALTPQQGDFLKRCSEVVVRSADAVIPTVLEAMNNDKTQPQSQLATNINASQLNNLDFRFAELRQGTQGFSVGGMAFSVDGQTMSLAMLGDVFAKPNNSDQAGDAFSRWGFFLTGMYTNGGFSTNQSRPGFDFDNASITAGVDYRFSDSFVGGVAVGYNHDNSDLDLNAGGLNVDGYNVTAYFTWYHANDFYVEGSASYGWLDYDLKRNIIYQIAAVDGSGGITNVNQVARASPGGDVGSLSLTLGHDFNNGAWAFSPYLRGTYAHLSLDGFTETIDNSNPGFGLATTVGSRSSDSELGVLGGRVSYTLNESWGVLVPNAVVEWNHEFKTDPQTVVYRFVSDPTQTPVFVTDVRPDSSYFNLGIGLNAVLPQGRSGFFYYEHVTGYTGAHINRYSVGVRVEF